jgi:nucleoside-diphosphate-sugar epimerase
MRKIAAVTGATGLVGKRIVELLLEKGLTVRILTRNSRLSDNRLEVHCGNLSDRDAVKKLLVGVRYLFHCAAELHDKSKMWETNVLGTKHIVDASVGEDFTYMCHLSSVGVMGKISGIFADETTPCCPLNTYEKTKYEAEKMMLARGGYSRVVVLRPTNVIDQTNREKLNIDRLKLFVKGGENAHVVHARDVAHAAAFFMDEKPTTSKPDCYIVSCDDDPMNTVAGCWALLHDKNSGSKVHLPWIVPYVLRRIVKGPCNRGDLRYSSKKLIAAGYNFKLGFKGAMRDIKPMPFLNHLSSI